MDTSLLLKLSGIGDDDAGLGVAVLGAVLRGQGFDQLERRLVEDSSEDDVLPVQLVELRHRDEELGPVGVGPVVGHRNKS